MFTGICWQNCCQENPVKFTVFFLQCRVKYSLDKGPPGVALDFHFVAAPRAEQSDLRTDPCRIWDPSELNFLTKCSLVN